MTFKAEELNTALGDVKLQGQKIAEMLNELFNLTSAAEDVDYQGALEQLKEQQNALEVSGKLMGELLRKLQDSSTTQQGPGKSENDPLTVKFGPENAGTQIGANSGVLTFRRPRLKSQGRA